MHAIPAREIAGRGDDAAASGMADDQRLIPQLRPVALFNRCIECIAIDMGYAQIGDLVMADEPERAAIGADLLACTAQPAAISAQGLPHGWLCSSLLMCPGD